MIITREEVLMNEEQRKELIGRVDVLDKVGNLLLLGNSQFATTQQVADYYGVGISTMDSLIARHKEELETNGLKLCKRSDIAKSFEHSSWEFKSMRGKTVAYHNEEQQFNVTGKGILLFSKRAILNVGMLLTDSDIAEEVRSRLLDIVHDAEEVITDNGNTIVENVVEEILDEKAIILEKVEAEMKGDYATVSICNAKLFALKNKRIIELEENIKTITSHSLTISQSRDVINRLVRVIAQQQYSGKYKFADCWNDIWSKVNYKLGINIKSRIPENSKCSRLTYLTEEETFKMEEIIRTYANKIGINVQEKLELA